MNPVTTKKLLSAVGITLLVGLTGCTSTQTQQTTDNSNLPAATGGGPPTGGTGASTATTSNLPCCTNGGGVVTAPSTGTNTTPVVTVPTTTNPAPVVTQPSIPVAQPHTPSAPATQPQISAPDGRPAVQVLASSQPSTAQQMVQQMRSAGFNAVIVQAGGLYKVRVPYNSVDEARANLNAVRAIAPDAFVSH